MLLGLPESDTVGLLCQGSLVEINKMGVFGIKAERSIVAFKMALIFAFVLLTSPQDSQKES